MKIKKEIEQLAENSSEIQEATYTTQHKITYKHGYIDGYNQCQENITDKWISVEDRLPKLASFVIAYKDNGLVLGLYFNADSEFKYGEIDQTSQVTHWMSLPDKPLNKQD